MYLYANLYGKGVDRTRICHIKNSRVIYRTPKAFSHVPFFFTLLIPLFSVTLIKHSGGK